MKLSDEELREIVQRVVVAGSTTDDADDLMDLAICRAGYRAGMERAADICDGENYISPDYRKTDYYIGHADGVEECAAAIRREMGG